MNGHGSMNNITNANPTPGGNIDVWSLAKALLSLAPALMSLTQGANAADTEVPAAIAVPPAHVEVTPVAAVVSPTVPAVAEVPPAAVPAAVVPPTTVVSPTVPAVAEVLPAAVPPTAVPALAGEPVPVEREPATYSSVKRIREEVYKHAPAEPAKRARSEASVDLQPVAAAPVPAPVQPVPAPVQPVPAPVQPVPAHAVQIRPAAVPWQMRQDMENATFRKLNSTEREYEIGNMIRRNGLDPDDFTKQGIALMRRDIAAIPAKMLALYELEKSKAKKLELVEWVEKMRAIHK